MNRGKFKIAPLIWLCFHHFFIAECIVPTSEYTPPLPYEAEQPIAGSNIPKVSLIKYFMTKWNKEGYKSQLQVSKSSLLINKTKKLRTNSGKFKSRVSSNLNIKQGINNPDFQTSRATIENKLQTEKARKNELKGVALETSQILNVYNYNRFLNEKQVSGSLQYRDRWHNINHDSEKEYEKYKNNEILLHLQNNKIRNKYAYPFTQHSSNEEEVTEKRNSSICLGKSSTNSQMTNKIISEFSGYSLRTNADYMEEDLKKCSQTFSEKVQELNLKCILHREAKRIFSQLLSSKTIKQMQNSRINKSLFDKVGYLFNKHFTAEDVNGKTHSFILKDARVIINQNIKPMNIMSHCDLETFQLTGKFNNIYVLLFFNSIIMIDDLQKEVNFIVELRPDLLEVTIRGSIGEKDKNLHFFKSNCNESIRWKISINHDKSQNTTFKFYIRRLSSIIKSEILTLLIICVENIFRNLVKVYNEGNLSKELSDSEQDITITIFPPEITSKWAKNHLEKKNIAVPAIFFATIKIEATNTSCTNDEKESSVISISKYIKTNESKILQNNPILFNSSITIKFESISKYSEICELHIGMKKNEKLFNLRNPKECLLEDIKSAVDLLLLKMNFKNGHWEKYNNYFKDITAKVFESITSTVKAKIKTDISFLKYYLKKITRLERLGPMLFVCNDKYILAKFFACADFHLILEGFLNNNEPISTIFHLYIKKANIFMQLTLENSEPFSKIVNLTFKINYLYENIIKPDKETVKALRNQQNLTESIVFEISKLIEKRILHLLPINFGTFLCKFGNNNVTETFAFHDPVEKSRTFKYPWVHDANSVTFIFQNMDEPLIKQQAVQIKFESNISPTGIQITKQGNGCEIKHNAQMSFINIFAWNDMNENNLKCDSNLSNIIRELFVKYEGIVNFKAGFNVSISEIILKAFKNIKTISKDNFSCNSKYVILNNTFEADIAIVLRTRVSYSSTVTIDVEYLIGIPGASIIRQILYRKHISATNPIKLNFLIKRMKTLKIEVHKNPIKNYISENAFSRISKICHNNIQEIINIALVNRFCLSKIISRRNLLKYPKKRSPYKKFQNKNWEFQKNSVSLKYRDKDNPTEDAMNIGVHFNCKNMPSFVSILKKEERDCTESFDRTQFWIDYFSINHIRNANQVVYNSAIKKKIRSLFGVIKEEVKHKTKASIEFSELKIEVIQNIETNNEMEFKCDNKFIVTGTTIKIDTTIDFKCNVVLDEDVRYKVKFRITSSDVTMQIQALNIRNDKESGIIGLNFEIINTGNINVKVKEKTIKSQSKTISADSDLFQDICEILQLEIHEIFRIVISILFYNLEKSPEGHINQEEIEVDQFEEFTNFEEKSVTIVVRSIENIQNLILDIDLERQKNKFNIKISRQNKECMENDDMEKWWDEYFSKKAMKVASERSNGNIFNELLKKGAFEKLENDIKSKTSCSATFTHVIVTDIRSVKRTKKLIFICSENRIIIKSNLKISIVIKLKSNIVFKDGFTAIVIFEFVMKGINVEFRTMLVKNGISIAILETNFLVTKIEKQDVGVDAKIKGTETNEKRMKHRKELTLVTQLIQREGIEVVQSVLIIVIVNNEKLKVDTVSNMQEITSNDEVTEIVEDKHITNNKKVITDETVDIIDSKEEVEKIIDEVIEDETTGVQTDIKGSAEEITEVLEETKISEYSKVEEFIKTAVLINNINIQDVKSVAKFPKHSVLVDFRQLQTHSEDIHKINVNFEFSKESFDIKNIVEKQNCAGNIGQSGFSNDYFHISRLKKIKEDINNSQLKSQFTPIFSLIKKKVMKQTNCDLMISHVKVKNIKKIQRNGQLKCASNAKYTVIKTPLIMDLTIVLVSTITFKNGFKSHFKFVSVIKDTKVIVRTLHNKGSNKIIKTNFVCTNLHDIIVDSKAECKVKAHEKHIEHTALVKITAIVNHHFPSVIYISLIDVFVKLEKIDIIETKTTDQYQEKITEDVKIHKDIDVVEDDSKIFSETIDVVTDKVTSLPIINDEKTKISQKPDIKDGKITIEIKVIIPCENIEDIDNFVKFPRNSVIIIFRNIKKFTYTITKIRIVLKPPEDSFDVLEVTQGACNEEFNSIDHWDSYWKETKVSRATQQIKNEYLVEVHKSIFENIEKTVYEKTETKIEFSQSKVKHISIKERKNIRSACNEKYGVTKMVLTMDLTLVISSTITFKNGFTTKIDFTSNIVDANCIVRFLRLRNRKKINIIETNTFVTNLVDVTKKLKVNVHEKYEDKIDEQIIERITTIIEVQIPTVLYISITNIIITLEEINTIEHIKIIDKVDEEIEDLTDKTVIKKKVTHKNKTPNNTPETVEDDRDHEIKKTTAFLEKETKFTEVVSSVTPIIHDTIDETKITETKTTFDEYEEDNSEEKEIVVEEDILIPDENFPDNNIIVKFPRFSITIRFRNVNKPSKTILKNRIDTKCGGKSFAISVDETENCQENFDRLKFWDNYFHSVKLKKLNSVIKISSLKNKIKRIFKIIKDKAKKETGAEISLYEAKIKEVNRLERTGKMDFACSATHIIIKTRLIMDIKVVVKVKITFKNNVFTEIEFIAKLKNANVVIRTLHLKNEKTVSIIAINFVVTNLREITIDHIQTNNEKTHVIKRNQKVIQRISIIIRQCASSLIYVSLTNLFIKLEEIHTIEVTKEEETRTIVDVKDEIQTVSPSKIKLTTSSFETDDNDYSSDQIKEKEEIETDERSLVIKEEIKIDIVNIQDTNDYTKFPHNSVTISFRNIETYTTEISNVIIEIKPARLSFRISEVEIYEETQEVIKYWHNYFNLITVVKIEEEIIDQYLVKKTENIFNHITTQVNQLFNVHISCTKFKTKKIKNVKIKKINFACSDKYMIIKSQLVIDILTTLSCTIQVKNGFKTEVSFVSTFRNSNVIVSILKQKNPKTSGAIEVNFFISNIKDAFRDIKFKVNTKEYEDIIDDTKIFKITKIIRLYIPYIVYISLTNTFFKIEKTHTIQTTSEEIIDEVTEIKVTPKTEEIDGTTVTPTTEVTQKIEIIEEIIVTPKTEITEKTEVTEEIIITPKTEITEKTKVTEEIIITPKTEITEKTKVTEEIIVTPKTEVTEKAEVSAITSEATPHTEITKIYTSESKIVEVIEEITEEQDSEIQITEIISTLEKYAIEFEYRDVILIPEKNIEDIKVISKIPSHSFIINYRNDDKYTIAISKLSCLFQHSEESFHISINNKCEESFDVSQFLQDYFKPEKISKLDEQIQKGFLNKKINSIFTFLKKVAKKMTFSETSLPQVLIKNIKNIRITQKTDCACNEKHILIKSHLILDFTIVIVSSVRFKNGVRTNVKFIAQLKNVNVVIRTLHIRSKVKCSILKLNFAVTNIQDSISDFKCKFDSNNLKTKKIKVTLSTITKITRTQVATMTYICLASIFIKLEEIHILEIKETVEEIDDIIQTNHNKKKIKTKTEKDVTDNDEETEITDDENTHIINKDTEIEEETGETSVTDETRSEYSVDDSSIVLIPDANIPDIKVITKRPKYSISITYRDINKPIHSISKIKMIFHSKESTFNVATIREDNECPESRSRIEFINNYFEPKQVSDLVKTSKNKHTQNLVQQVFKIIKSNIKEKTSVQISFSTLKIKELEIIKKKYKTIVKCNDRHAIIKRPIIVDMVIHITGSFKFKDGKQKSVTFISQIRHAIFIMRALYAINMKNVGMSEINLATTNFHHSIMDITEVESNGVELEVLQQIKSCIRIHIPVTVYVLMADICISLEVKNTIQTHSTSTHVETSQSKDSLTTDTEESNESIIMETNTAHTKELILIKNENIQDSETIIKYPKCSATIIFRNKRKPVKDILNVKVQFVPKVISFDISEVFVKEECFKSVENEMFFENYFEESRLTIVENSKKSEHIDLLSKKIFENIKALSLQKCQSKFTAFRLKIKELKIKSEKGKRKSACNEDHVVVKTLLIVDMTIILECSVVLKNGFSTEIDFVSKLENVNVIIRTVHSRKIKNTGLLEINYSVLNMKDSVKKIKTVVKKQTTEKTIIKIIEEIIQLEVPSIVYVSVADIFVTLEMDETTVSEEDVKRKSKQKEKNKNEVIIEEKTKIENIPDVPSVSKFPKHSCSITYRKRDQTLLKLSEIKVELHSSQSSFNIKGLTESTKCTEYVERMKFYDIYFQKEKLSKIRNSMRNQYLNTEINDQFKDLEGDIKKKTSAKISFSKFTRNIQRLHKKEEMKYLCSDKFIVLKTYLLVDLTLELHSTVTSTKNNRSADISIITEIKNAEVVIRTLHVRNEKTTGILEMNFAITNLKDSFSSSEDMSMEGPKEMLDEGVLKAIVKTTQYRMAAKAHISIADCFVELESINMSTEN